MNKNPWAQLAIHGRKLPENFDLTVQPQSLSEGGKLWTLAFQANGKFAIGQGGTLVEAIRKAKADAGI